MARLPQADVEALGLTEEDLEVLDGVDLPDEPEVELTGEDEDAFGWAEEARTADLVRVAELDEAGVRYLTEVAPDPLTDGLEHEDDLDDLRRRSDAEEQPRSLLPVDDLLDLKDLESLGVRAAVTGGVRIPGFVWKPFTNREVSTTPLVGPRAIIDHTMGVGTMLGSWSYHNASGMPYTHGYYDGIGNRVQAQGADRRAAGTLEGNPYVIAFETEDYGRWFPNAGRTCGSIPPWRPEQLAVLAKDHAWLCVRFGIPAVLMPDSCASTRGIGYHRLGIYPWRKAGCLRYSNSNYKCCPDVARIAQMPGLIRSTANIIGGQVGTVTAIDAEAQKQIKLLVHAAIREELPAAIKAIWNHQIDMGETNHPAEAVLRDARVISRRTEGVAQETLAAVQALPASPPS